jgi:hypothetical protein
MKHADFQGGVSRQISGMLRGNVRIGQRTKHNRDMQRVPAVAAINRSVARRESALSLAQPMQVAAQP